MNSISVSGNLGKDSEMRSLADGTPVLSFSVADSQGRDKNSIWWDCSLFGKRADSLQTYLVKGQQVTVIGNVTEREWTDKDGQKRKSFGVRVQDVALMGGKREASEPRQASRPPEKQAGSSFYYMDDSDLPF
ncbi:MAG: single-stranded DNA-binding protein [Pseudomonadota bacterium]|nr:single-stranded DNA-binding protein [Pseudomonadota bacterium]